MEKNYYKAYLYVTGIKKRCRKIEKHQIELGNFELTDTDSVVAAVAKTAILIEMKEVQGNPFVSLCYMTDLGDGLVRTTLLDERNKRIEVNYE